jgi:hypothetical protein
MIIEDDLKLLFDVGNGLSVSAIGCLFLRLESYNTTRL